MPGCTVRTPSPSGWPAPREGCRICPHSPATSARGSRWGCAAPGRPRSNPDLPLRRIAEYFSDSDLNAPVGGNRAQSATTGAGDARAARERLTHQPVGHRGAAGGGEVVEPGRMPGPGIHARAPASAPPRICRRCAGGARRQGPQPLVHPAAIDAVDQTEVRRIVGE